MLGRLKEHFSLVQRFWTFFCRHKFSPLDLVGDHWLPSS